MSETVSDKTKINLPAKYQVALFVTGFLLFQIVSAIIALIVHTFIEDTKSVEFITTVNSATYILLAITLIVTLWKYLKSILKTFKVVSAIGWGALAFLVMLLLLKGWTIIKDLLPEPKYLNGNEQGIRDMIRNYPTIAFFVVCVLAPICEELTYRVGLFSLCKRKNRVLAYVVTCIVFTLLHVKYTDTDFYSEIIAVPSYLIGAIVLTCSYDYFGLPGSLTTHIINNVINYIVILNTKD